MEKTNSLTSQKIVLSALPEREFNLSDFSPFHFFLRVNKIGRFDYENEAWKIGSGQRNIERMGGVSKLEAYDARLPYCVILKLLH